MGEHHRDAGAIEMMAGENQRLAQVRGVPASPASAGSRAPARRRRVNAGGGVRAVLVLSIKAPATSYAADSRYCVAKPVHNFEISSSVSGWKVMRTRSICRSRSLRGSDAAVAL